MSWHATGSPARVAPERSTGPGACHVPRLSSCASHRRRRLTETRQGRGAAWVQRGPALSAWVQRGPALSARCGRPGAVGGVPSGVGRGAVGAVRSARCGRRGPARLAGLGPTFSTAAERRGAPAGPGGDPPGSHPRSEGGYPGDSSVGLEDREVRGRVVRGDTPEDASPFSRSGNRRGSGRPGGVGGGSASGGAVPTTPTRSLDRLSYHRG